MSEESLVVLRDGNGSDVRFLHIMTFDFENSFYVALTPEDKVDGFENGEVLLMEIREDEDGTDIYLPIENEQQLKDVWEEFEKLYYEDDEEE